LIAQGYIGRYLGRQINGQGYILTHQGAVEQFVQPFL
jgi:hypothetical protein